MSETEVKIIHAATDVITRQGLNKISMSDIAAAAGVSRQTLYATFRNKSALLNAVVFHANAAILREVEADWQRCASAAEMLDIYFEKAVLAPFDILQTHPELRALFASQDPAQIAIIHASRLEWAAALSAYLPQAVAGQATPATQDIAAYVVQVAKDLKLSSANRAELQARLKVLKAGVLALL